VITQQLGIDRSEFGLTDPDVSRRRFLCALASGLAVSGCRSTEPDHDLLPARHSVQADQLVVLSDFRLNYDHPLIADLIELRREVARTLALEFNGPPVVVYLFPDEKKYYNYLKTTYPTLPDRRAYFIGTSFELAVYTYWGKRIQEDLRHEFTHGLLHSTLLDVPLWLDEGLAEYFELDGPAPGTIHTKSAEELSAAIANGWKPDLKRLESLREVSMMNQADYREAWAWVHFMLHSSEGTQQLLIEYLQELQTDPNPVPLRERLETHIPILTERFRAYVAGLNGTPANLATL
jgi:hypothetical protein